MTEEEAERIFGSGLIVFGAKPPTRKPRDEMFDRVGLLTEIRRGFTLDWAGHHGANHWGRVRYHALAIAQARGADALVVELFAFLHDSQRQDEWRDPGHGARGAEYARALQGRFFNLRPAQIDRLAHAIRHHSGGEVSTDVTIQTCWDADRLDLGRVGIEPSEEFLSEEGARRISLAHAWSRGRARRHDKYSGGSIFEPAT
jgi:uncharacterized protein